MKMNSGYAFEYDGPNWPRTADDNWEIVIFSPTGGEKFVGERWIDGAKVAVFMLPDGSFRAQTVASCR